MPRGPSAQQLVFTVDILICHSQKTPGSNNRVIIDVIVFLIRFYVTSDRLPGSARTALVFLFVSKLVLLSFN